MKRNSTILTAIGAIGALCAATFIRMDSLSAAYPFPCNANTSMAVYVPAAGSHGTLMLEDQWPGFGDLDFNDAVVNYQYSFAYNSAGNLTQLVGTFNVLAAGSGHDNGFALHVPIPKANVSSVTLQQGNGAPSALAARAADSELVVDILPNIKAAFNLANDGHQINTDPSAAVLPGATYRLVVTLSTPTALSSAGAPFDAFFYWSQTPSHEIHRPGYAGTAAMNAALFGTLQDGSTGARHFVDNRGIPYVLDVPQNIKWPKESTDISGGYSQLAAFGASGGVSNQTWYQSPTNAPLFTSGQGGAQPPGPSFVGGADGSFTVDGTCNLCVANNVSCPAAPDQCHDQGTCAPATGVCSAAPAKANGTACDDGNASTSNDVCTNGTCAGTPVGGNLPVGCAVASDGTVWCATQTLSQTGSQICGYPDGYAGTYYAITAAGAAALGKTIFDYGDCATNYVYSGNTSQIRGSAMSCWTDAQRWARSGNTSNGVNPGGNVVRCTNLEGGQSATCGGNLLADPQQVVANWTLCYLPQSPNPALMGTPCSGLFNSSGKSYGCWHSNATYPHENQNNTLASACSPGVQNSTTYNAWGGTSHILTVCIHN
ncbi:MAG: LruC domain-containing protein [Byssovorax sp.]